MKGQALEKILNEISKFYKEVVKELRPELTRAFSRFIISAGFSAGIAGVAIGLIPIFSKNFQTKNTVESRIELLTKNLQSSSKIISEIEEEYKLRAQLLEKLKKDAEQAEALSKLHGPEVAAIAQALEKAIDNKTKWDAWIGILQNVFFAIFGVAVGELWNRYKAKRKGVDIISG